MNLKNMTIRVRLSVTFGVLIAILALVSGMAVMNLYKDKEMFTNYVNGTYALQVQAYEVRHATEERAIMLRDMINATDKKDKTEELNRFKEEDGKVSKRTQTLLDMVNEFGMDPQGRALLDKMIADEKHYAAVTREVLDLDQQGRHEEAIAKMMDAEYAASDAYIMSFRASRDHGTETGNKLIQEFNTNFERQSNIILVFALLALTLAIVSGVMIIRNLTRSLGAEPAQLKEVAERVASGDLSPSDETHPVPDGSVLSTLKAMQRNLAGIVGTVRNNSDSIVTGTMQITSGNADLSQRTESQASSLQQTAASMEQLSATVKSSAEIAAKANMMAAEASETARHGGEKVDLVIHAMQDISNSSRTITDIIGVIDSIAFQTNILALNAAVEAARAGEHGRGFAVVSGEVRTLAQRSAQAAGEIKNLINASVEQVDAGSKLVAEAGESMQVIVTQTQGVSQMIDELTLAANEQSQGISQVGIAVQQIDEVTQQNAALVVENAAAAESLHQQAGQLMQIMTQFRLGSNAA
ncbi:TPA: methyl-accepting chemotaxis protein [Vibrio vulnificus]|nr:methyl-accepting chemotaxis protein [Vibrio vulnificus]